MIDLINFKNLKIRTKLIAIILITVYFSAASGFVLIVINDIAAFKEYMADNAMAISEVTGSNLIAELDFYDSESAEETLLRLEEIESVIGAYVFTNDGELFAKFSKDEIQTIGPKLIEPNSYKYIEGELNVYRDINFKGRKYGSIYLVLSTAELMNKIKNYIMIVAGIGILVLGLSFIIALRLQKFISEPITHLADIIREITVKNEYDVAVEKKGDDEIGDLYDGFNEMLEQIHSRQEDNDRILGELKRAQFFLKNVIESMPSMLVTVDKNGIITQWNQAAAEITEITSMEAIGKTLWDIAPYFSKYKSYSNEIMHSKKTREFYRDVIMIGGEKYYMNISLFPLTAEGINGVVIRADDISEIEKKEAQLLQAQKMEIVGTLAGGLAHDFNNVLGGILGTLSLLEFKEKKKHIEQDELEKYLHTIKDASERAADMVKQLLTLSRKQEMTFAPVDLNLSVKHVMKICQNTFDKSIELAPEFSKKRPVVNADPTQIEQVILNLCVNSSHAMTIMRGEEESWGGTLSINIEEIHADDIFCKNHTEAEKRDYWRISIADEGVGIDTKTASKIFEPFFTTKDKGKGTGLGLAMAYNIIKQHGGFIDLYSEVGISTVFNIYLPSLNTEAVDYKNRVQDEEVFRGSGLILVVDDEPIMRQLAKEVLEECGYSVVLAKHGEEGMEIFKRMKEQINAVLLDMVMPKKSGKETFVEMKKIKPNVKVLLASGFKKDSRVEEVLKLGVKGFVQKPYTFHDLAKSMYEIAYT